MKRVLVVSFSQTGQLEEIVCSLIAPLEDCTDISVRHIYVEPVTRPPFPWPVLRFFDLFPECVFLDPPPIKPIAVGEDEDYDLVIIAYQVWFLSPSMPITAFFKSDAACRLLAGKPVVTLIGCRNMWALAQEKMKALLADISARHVDNVVLTARGGLWTFVTEPYWLLTGRKTSLPGLPPAGIAREDIDACARFGHALVAALAAGRERDGRPMLTGLRAVEADPSLVAMERLGHRSFWLWGKVLRAIGPAGSSRRLPFVAIYAVFLALVIALLVPANLLILRLLKPLLVKRWAAEKAHFEQPSGSTGPALALPQPLTASNGPTRRLL
jgi:hypothetical protein